MKQYAMPYTWVKPVKKDDQTLAVGKQTKLRWTNAAICFVAPPVTSAELHRKRLQVDGINSNCLLVQNHVNSALLTK